MSENNERKFIPAEEQKRLNPEETQEDLRLNPEVEKIVIDKVQDINKEGTAYSAIAMAETEKGPESWQSKLKNFGLY